MCLKAQPHAAMLHTGDGAVHKKKVCPGVVFFSHFLFLGSKILSIFGDFFSILAKMEKKVSSRTFF